MSGLQTLTSTTVTGGDTITADLGAPAADERWVVHSVYWSITTVVGTVTATATIDGVTLQVGTVIVASPKSWFGVVAGPVGGEVSFQMTAGTSITTAAVHVTYTRQRGNG